MLRVDIKTLTLKSLRSGVKHFKVGRGVSGAYYGLVLDKRVVLKYGSVKNRITSNEGVLQRAVLKLGAALPAPISNFMISSGRNYAGQIPDRTTR